MSGLTKRLAWRVQADYLRTDFYKQLQDNYRFQTGIVLRFTGGKKKRPYPEIQRTRAAALLPYRHRHRAVGATDTTTPPEATPPHLAPQPRQHDTTATTPTAAGAAK